MRSRQRLASMGICAVLMVALVPGVAARVPRSEQAPAGGGPSFGATADLDYFLALNASHEKSDDASAPSGFTSYSKTLGPVTITGPEGSAKAKATVNVQLTASGGSLRSVRTSSSVSGNATKSGNDNAPGIPVSSPESSVNVDFSVSAATPYTLSATVNASNSDHNDCTEVVVELAGDTVAFRRTRTAGGDCGSHDADVTIPSGVLQPGSYTLSLDAGGTIDPNYPGSESMSGGWNVHLTLFDSCTITGSSDPDTLNGTPGDDVICALGGPDQVSAGGGDDQVFGGPGDDVITGGPGGDLIYGEVGADRLFGNQDADILLGGIGPDVVCGDDGSDTVDGGPDDDDIVGGGGADEVFGGTGHDRMYGAGRDTITVPCPAGTTDGADTMVGGDGDDEMRGGGANDSLQGGRGSDKLLGENGADVLVGGPRKDVLSGGSGNDRLLARDGVHDVVHGGTGSSDKAKVDSVDDVDGVEALLP